MTTDAASARPVAPRWERLFGLLATDAGGLALVLAFRALFLLRFGGDPRGGMNINFLLEAKAIRFGYEVEMRMPLVRFLLAAMRDAGASAPVALGVLYLVGHTLIALGIFALARMVLRPGPRVRACVAIAVAILPALASDSGYRNIQCTLGTGLFTALAALLLTGPARAARLAVALVLAAAASCCRPESALCVAGLAVLLGVAGPRIGAGRAGALCAAVGFVIGFGFAQLAATRGAWGFYTFYNTGPFVLRLVSRLQRPGSTATEYARYIETARHLGWFAENGGSLVRALLHHPGYAALWFLTKPIDFLITLCLPDSFTPLALPLLWLAVRRARREGRRAFVARWAPLLGAFAAPLLFTIVLSQAGHAPYQLFAAPLLLLLALWGIEPWIERAPAAVAGRWAVGTLGAAAVLVAWLGSGAPTTSPALMSLSRWLQGRCAADGCLVNAVPQTVEAQVWANLRAGARLPPKDKRSEAFVLGQYPPAFLREVRWAYRLEEARARGWRGPTLYVRLSGRSKFFDDGFEPEHRLESDGEPPLGGAAAAVTFDDGADRAEVFELAPPAAPR